jgi:ribosomal protein L37E
MHCQNCGKANTQQSNFCRFCGTKFTAVQYSQPTNYNPAPNPVPNPVPNPMPNPAPVNTDNLYETMQRRPYSWKTDEYQLPDDKTRTKPVNQVPPLPNFPPPSPQNMSMQPFQQQMGITSHVVCPRCARQNFPIIKQQVSTAGWITFAILLVTIFPLFWIGLLIKEDAFVCPVCNFKYR